MTSDRELLNARRPKDMTLVKVLRLPLAKREIYIDGVQQSYYQLTALQ